MPLRIYTLSNCDRCRAATKWLRAHSIPFEEIPIREQPPSIAELKTMWRTLDDIRRLFNTSGRDYRELNLGEKLDGLDEPAVFALLHENGNLVKRPFLVGDGVALIGFSEEAWQRALG